MIGYESLHVEFVELVHYVSENYVPEPLHQLPERWNARQIVWQNSKLSPVSNFLSNVLQNVR
jgi:hypothetical protein